MMLAALQLGIALTGLQSDADLALDAHRASKDLPGISAAIAIQGEVVFAGSAGVADLASGRTLTADTPLYIGSVSKVFTAVLVLQAIERQDLQLTTHPATGGPVDEATVFDLLTHSSGLPREGNFNYWFTGVFPDSAELDDYLRNQALRFPPESELSYSNIGYAALGRELETATGQPFAAQLSEHILRPLGLGATGTGSPPDELARGYTPRNRLIPSASRPFAGVGAAEGDRFLREYHEAESMTPAFGIYSSASDLVRLGSALIEEDDSILRQDSRQAMLSRQRFGRGLGLQITRLSGRNVARHGGWFAAHRSALLLDDRADICVVVLANSDDGDPHTLADELYGLTISHLEGRADAGPAAE